MYHEIKDNLYPFLTNFISLFVLTPNKKEMLLSENSFCHCNFFCIRMPEAMPLLLLLLLCLIVLNAGSIFFQPTFNSCPLKKKKSVPIQRPWGFFKNSEVMLPCHFLVEEVVNSNSFQNKPCWLLRCVTELLLACHQRLTTSRTIWCLCSWKDLYLFSSHVSILFFSFLHT